MRRALLVLVVVASALATGCSCENMRANTQVMATIDAEPGVRGMARQLVVRVYGAPGGQSGVPDTLVQEFPFPVSASDGWPTTVALAPEGRDPSRRYRIEAVALSTGGAEIATVRAISGYAEEQTLWLQLLLLDGCIGVTCDDPGQTCIGPDQCGDATIDVEDLMPWARDAGVLDGSTVDGGECDPAACDDGLACTSDYCDENGECAHTRSAALCDDDNPCTEDTCSGDPADGPSGCAYVNNTLDCDDGVFCNGLDACSGGECVHAGDPCGASLECEEETDRCLGCARDEDCPARMEGAYGACGYADACDEDATQSRTVRTFTCVDSACEPSDGEETRACSRDTDGTSCGTTTYGEWLCSGFDDTCDVSGTESRFRYDAVCTDAACASVPTLETQPCSRATDDLPCSDGLGCNGIDSCQGGLCVGEPCMDGGIGCDAGSCSDGVECTIDSCGASGCLHAPNDALCPPGAPCETVRCDALAGCVYDRSRCNDGGGPVLLDGGVMITPDGSIAID
ncbi:hypothetical protein [Sandaracinus amylolyticus]|uniref:Tryptophan synthase alpha chain n=1 Tax=Sandaracinus amylolyticus TaxID=927083 RepID=A0A0F6WAH8_9BACT|nr:hypothetical protein [Sandaracinus amylolyticus]AKF11593.1 hypothetical protein DB32_008742 [Sandaracinus amylolyticus]